MQKIVPNLWFDNQAEEAADFYVSIFPDSEILGATHYTEAGPGPEGSVLTVEFRLGDQEFVMINGGPHDEFNDSISLAVVCETQDEIDHYWEKLTAGGGREVQCGWLKDKYGVSWQVVPMGMRELMSGDPEGVDRAMQAVLKMVKLDIAEIEAAYKGDPTPAT